MMWTLINDHQQWREFISQCQGAARNVLEADVSQEYPLLITTEAPDYTYVVIHLSPFRDEWAADLIQQTLANPTIDAVNKLGQKLFDETNL